MISVPDQRIESVQWKDPLKGVGHASGSPRTTAAGVPLKLISPCSNGQSDRVAMVEVRLPGRTFMRHLLTPGLKMIVRADTQIVDSLSEKLARGGISVKIFYQEQEFPAERLKMVQLYACS